MSEAKRKRVAAAGLNEQAKILAGLMDSKPPEGFFSVSAFVSAKGGGNWETTRKALDQLVVQKKAEKTTYDQGRKTAYRIIEA